MNFPQDGRIDRILINDNDRVHKDNILMLMEDQLEYDQYQYLKNYAEQLESQLYNSDESSITKIGICKGAGRFKNVCATLNSHIRELSDFITRGEYGSKEMSLINLIESYKSMDIHYNQMESLINNKTQIQRKQLARLDSLFKGGAIPEVEYEKAQSDLLSLQQKQQDVQSKKSENRIKISQINKELKYLNWDYRNKKNEIITAISKANAKLIQELSDWEAEYIVKAPISGMVNYTGNWCAGQFVPQGETILTIEPEEESLIIGKFNCPAYGAGEIKRNQKVKISIENFPSSEYGYVWGEVNKIAATPVNGEYFVDIVFPDGLKTSRGFEIDFDQYAVGSAKVFISENSILRHIINTIIEAS